jgi:7,8-dihydropterin-6-yl-methyl-4-(beta-D-ribofuranosyl)aminobenzene 5'-phosphate synthase
MKIFRQMGIIAAVISGCGLLVAAEPRQVKALKIMLLSTMLADGEELGEWGFAALVEADGRRILFDTGARTDVVLKNARSMEIDLTNVPDVVLSHWHSDHVGGFLPLRRDVMAKQASALARAHVGEGIFLSRTRLPPGVEINPMVRLKPEYEASGGTFVVHAKAAEIYPGVWLTGPVPRRHPERNWSGGAQVRTDKGVVEDTIVDDMALVVNTADGLVIVTGCGHAGVVNIVEHARAIVRPARVHALIGGIHLFNAAEKTLAWTTTQLRAFGVDHFIGAHCTGIETVYRFRGDLGLDRARCVVGAVGATFELGQGIDPRLIAK